MYIEVVSHRHSMAKGPHLSGLVVLQDHSDFKGFQLVYSLFSDAERGGIGFV